MIEDRILELLDEGRDAKQLAATIDDNTIDHVKAADRLLSSGVEPDEIVRISRWDTCRALMDELLEAGANVNRFAKKFLDASYSDTQLIDLVSKYGVAKKHLVALIEDKKHAEYVLRNIDRFYARGYKLKIDELLGMGVEMGRLGDDIKKLVEVGYPVKKIVQQCVEAYFISFETVVALAECGVDISEIAEAHLPLVTEHPLWFKPEDPEKLYWWLHRGSDLRALVDGFGLDLNRVVGKLVKRQEYSALEDNLELLLEHGWSPWECMELVDPHYSHGNSTSYGPVSAVKHFKLFKRYNPRFDLDPRRCYQISHEVTLKELLACGANRKAIVQSVIYSAIYCQIQREVILTMLDAATAGEAWQLFVELPPSVVARLLPKFVESDKLSRGDILQAIKRLCGEDGYPDSIIYALPTLYKHNIPLTRKALRWAVRSGPQLSKDSVDYLVKYGLTHLELFKKMRSEAIEANVEALVQEGLDPDKIAQKCYKWYPDGPDEAMRERLRKAGAKLWV